MFQVNFGNCNGAFGVPNDIVDKHIKLSGALSLKVLLVLLRYGRAMELSELGELLGQTEGDIRDSLNQWLELGIVENLEATGKQVAEAKPKIDVKATNAVEVVELKQEPEAAVAVSNTEAPEEPVAKPVSAKKVVKAEKFRRMTRADINELAMIDPNVAVLLEECQNLLGGLISNNESETLVSLYHNYGMELDIILMLLTYCKSIGKTSTSQYEKIAMEWINKGIDTHEKAERELLTLTKQTDIETEIRELLEIPEQYLVDIKQRHIEYYKNWQSMNKDLVKLACERTINSIDTFSMDYMNTILEGWKQKNITTVDEANSENYSARKKKDKKAVPESSASYDLGKLEEMITHGSVWD